MLRGCVMLDRLKRGGISPFRGILNIQDEMNKLFGTFFDDELPAMGVGFVPTVDVSETKKDIKIRADLPGITEKDIDISITDSILTIKGKGRGKRGKWRKFLQAREVLWELCKANSSTCQC